MTSFLRVPVILEQVRDKAHTDLPEPLRTKPSSLANGTPEKVGEGLPWKLCGSGFVKGMGIRYGSWKWELERSVLKNMFSFLN